MPASLHATGQTAHRQLRKSFCTAQRAHWVFGLIVLFCLTYMGLNPAEARQISLSAEQDAYLQKKQDLKVCIDPDWMPYEAIDENGKITGMSSDYLSLIEDIIETPIVLHPTSTWQQTLNAAKNRDCDMLAMARETEDRLAYLDFTVPYLSFPYVIATTQNAPFIADIESHLDKTFAVVKGYAVADFLRTRYPGIQLYDVRNFDEGVSAIRAGFADGYVDSVVTIGHNISEKGLLDMRVGGEVDFSAWLSIATRNDEPLLAKILQKALNAIPEVAAKRIQNKWFSMSFMNLDSTGTPQLILTEEEAAYRDSTPSLNMCVDPSWMPFEGIENGVHTGIGGDAIRLISDRAGIEFRLQESQSWSEALEMFRSGQCDVMSMLNRTAARSKYMDFTEPYYKGHIVFIAQNDAPFIAEPEDILGKKVVVTKGYSVAEFLKRDFGDSIDLIEVDNYDIAFHMVARGQADLSADYLISSGERIFTHGLYNLRIAGNTPYKNELGIGVQKNNPILVSILNKAISTLRPQEMDDIVSNWQTVRFEQQVDYTLLWQVLGGAAIIVLIMGASYWRMSMARAKTQDALTALSKATEELEHRATTDKLTGLNNRAKLDDSLKEELRRASRFKQPFGVIMMDIDHFKAVNDTHGHQMGDGVLVKFAELIDQSTRETDITGRWGGEEFLIICPQSGTPQTIRVAEKLRQNLEAHIFEDIGGQTASFGVSIFQPGDTIDTLLARADQALYKAKETGRNRVVSSEAI